MKLDAIATKRSWQRMFWFDLVYEWEDTLAEFGALHFYYEKKFLYNKLFKRLPVIPPLLQSNKTMLVFEMEGIRDHYFTNRKRNIIPYIIDFYPLESDIPTFDFLYKSNPVVFISSAEVFDFLNNYRERHHVNIEHVALSLSDKYRITPDTRFIKKYDLVLMGRQNPVLMGFLKEYCLKHPDFVYVYNERKNGKLLYYTSKGDVFGNFDRREDYMGLMRQAKAGFYSTPGIDSEKDTHGFNQITPRFLELIASGCHIIARYKDNPDSNYYNVGEICKSINSYGEFEEALDKAIRTPVDMIKYSQYLDNHYTSKRSEQIKKILKRL